VLEVSTLTGEGMDRVRRHLRPGRTIVAVGSSGVGKSSLLNALAGRTIVSTGEIRGDDARGRHTTTRRELHRVGDGMIIDTPGLRELGVLDSAGVDESFGEIGRLAAACRFSDCRHEGEPGCAIGAALDDGSLAPERLRAYRKLWREARRAEIAGDALARRAEQRRWAHLIRDGRRQSRAKRGESR
jgi:ribosome biogenesis GTPase